MSGGPKDKLHARPDGTPVLTERQQADDALRQLADVHARQLRLFDGIASTTPDFIYVFDLQGRFLYANRRLLDVWGRKLDDVLGKTCFELGYQQWHHDMHMREIAQVIATRQPIKGEVPFEAPLTRIFGIYEYIFTPVLGPDGEVEVIAGTTRDVTERKQAEDALQESEARFRSVADHAPVMLWMTDPSARCTHLNQRWYEFTGQTPETGLGLGWLDVVHPDDFERSKSIFLSANEKREAFKLEYRLRRKDGVYRWAIDAASPRFGPNGEFLGYIGSVTDIDERMEMETALRASERETKRARDYAEATLRTSPVPLLVLESDLRVHTANEAFYEMFRVAPANTVGRLVYELGNGQWNIPKLRELLEDILPHHSTFHGFELAHDFESIGRRTMLLNARRMENEPGVPERIVLVIEDITEPKKAEEALRQSEERFRSLFLSIDEGFCIVEMIFDATGKPVDYRFEQANPAFSRLTGLENPVGKTARELVPDLEEFWFETYGRVAVTGQSIRFENISEPMQRWFDVYASRLGDADSRRLAIVFNNTTERKQANEQLRRGAELLNVLIDRSPTGFYIVDASFRISHVNSDSQARAFRNVNPAIGRRLDDAMRVLWPEPLATEIIEIFRHTLETGEPYKSPGLVSPRADLKTVETYEWQLERITMPDGRHAVVCYYYDTTPLREAEQELRKSGERFDIVRDGAQVGFWFCDLPFDKLIWDNRVKEHFWLAPDAAVTIHTFYERIHPDDRERTRAAIAASIAGRTRYDLEYRTVSAEDAREKWIRAIGRTFYDEQGRPIRFDGVTLDITEHKRDEEALRASRAELAEANEQLASRAKQLDSLVQQRTAKLTETIGELEGFSYSITHDMRAPLRAVNSFSHMLAEDYAGKLDDDGKRLLDRIQQAVIRMDKLIQDVLQYSKVLRMDLKLEPVDADRLVRGMLDSYPDLQEPKATVRIEGQLPEVFANEAALTQCFSNLLNNAVKFVPPGTKPQVTVCAVNGESKVRFWIEDNGIGIEPKYLENIFGLFQRLTNDYEGTGVGLSIVRKAVERMDGKAGVESVPGQGSRFWFELASAGSGMKTP